MFKKVLSTAFLLTSLVGGLAHAGSISLFDNSNSFNSDQGFSDSSSGQVFAAGFSVAQNSTADTFQFWGSDFDWANTFNITGTNTINNFDFDLYTGTNANQTVQSNITGTLSQNADNNGFVKFTFTFNPIQLLANTNYWLSINNDTSSNFDVDWVWGGASGGESLFSFDNGGNWESSSDNRGLIITGEIASASVPEPAAFILLSLGLLGVTLRRRIHR